MKRDLSIILCILMIFSLCTFNIKADDTNNDEQKDPTQGEVLGDAEPKTEEVTYVAQVGENKYETLQDAINATNNGDIVTIINDIVFKPIKNEDGTYSGQGYDGLYTNGGQSCSVVGTSYCYPTYTFNRIKNKDITIDLNNKNISVNCDFAAYMYYFDVEDNSNVTFTGEGTVDGNNPVGNSYNSPYLIYIDGNSNVTINSGTYKSCTTVQVYSGTVNITGGHFGQDTTIKKVYYTYNKNDYFIKYLINCNDAPYKNGNAKVNITGGTFEIFNPANNGAEGANTNFVSNGYKSVDEDKDNGEIWYTVENNQAQISTISTASEDSNVSISNISTDVLHNLPEIQNAVNNSTSDVSVQLSVTESTDETDNSKIEESLIEESESIASLFDITINLTVDQTQSTISSVPSGLDITIVIPSEYILNDSNKIRTYYIKYVHDGVLKEIKDGSFNSEDNTYTFKATEFSTYALVYKDVVKETKPDTSDKGTTSDTNTSNNVSTVKTCEEAIGRNWTWSEKSKTCVYRVTNTNTK